MSRKSYSLIEAKLHKSVIRQVITYQQSLQEHLLTIGAHLYHELGTPYTPELRKFLQYGLNTTRETNKPFILPSIKDIMTVSTAEELCCYLEGIARRSAQRLQDLIGAAPQAKAREVRPFWRCLAAFYARDTQRTTVGGSLEELHPSKIASEQAKASNGEPAPLELHSQTEAPPQSDIPYTCPPDM